MNGNKIAITMGDACGIGPEIILKSLSTSKEYRRQAILIGCFERFSLISKKLGLSLSLKEIKTEKDLLKDYGNKICVYNPFKINLSTIKFGKLSVKSSKASMLYIEEAVNLCKKGIVKAIVTAPITKEGIKKAGYNYNGHTDFLAELTNTKRYSMMFVYEDIRILLVTIHEPLNKISSMLSKKLINEKIKEANAAAILLGVKKPKIAIAGFNPHAGENSLFGDEEEKYITPAVKAAKKEKICIEGPIPPDTLFYRGITKKEFDIIISIYHDQGLIPFKMIAFDKGVNMTVGLPFVRTSPDHGTAYNIAEKMIANPDSMKNAIKTALLVADKKSK